MAEKSGYVYILKHQNGQTVKVGETSVSPQSRLEGYTETYQLEGFSIHKTFEVPLNSRQDIEKRAHSRLKKDRLSGIAGAREIFACTPSKAEMAIEQAISESAIYHKELVERLKRERIRNEQEQKRRKLKEEEKKIKKEREILLDKFKAIIKKDWEDSKRFKVLKHQLMEIKDSQINPIKLPFLYWYIWFSFAFTSILLVIGMIKSQNLRTDTGYLITFFVLSVTILMWWFPANRNSKNRQNLDKQKEISLKIKDEELYFIENKLPDFENYYLKNKQ